MKLNQWTVGLAAAGVVSLASVAQAEEQKSALQTALSQTVISGSISTSVILNPSSATTALPGRSFDGLTRQDGFNLDHVRLQLEKPMAEGEWAAGYKVEMIFGPDANLWGTPSTDSVGGFAGVTSDFAIKQAYLALRAPVGNGIDLKVGVWDTIIGYETFNPADNPNYSRSYAYALEPFTHTGVLASYRISDDLSVSAGLANATTVTGTTFPNNSNQINGRGDGEFRIRYMASVAYTVPEDGGFMKGSTLYAGFVSNEDAPGLGGSDIYNLYFGGTMATPIEGLRVGAAIDIVQSSDAADSYVYGLYTTFQVSEQMRVSGRAEYLDSDAATGISGLANQKIGSLVGTVDYKLWDNVLTRAEIRWDHDLEGDGGGAAWTEASSGDPVKDQVQFVLNLVYSF
jgi:Putative beta-barrel porin-2, OmpL-like. bbp2